MKIVFGILCIVFGCLNIIMPEIGWTLRHFLSVKDGEPTDFYLVFARVIGVVMVCAGIILLVMA